MSRGGGDSNRAMFALFVVNVIIGIAIILLFVVGLIVGTRPANTEPYVRSEAQLPAQLAEQQVERCAWDVVPHDPTRVQPADRTPGGRPRRPRFT